jgi:hypothetical protein
MARTKGFGYHCRASTTRRTWPAEVERKGLRRNRFSRSKFREKGAWGRAQSREKGAWGRAQRAPSPPDSPPARSARLWPRPKKIHEFLSAQTLSLDGSTNGRLDVAAGVTPCRKTGTYRKTGSWGKTGSYRKTGSCGKTGACRKTGSCRKAGACRKTGSPRPACGERGWG